MISPTLERIASMFTRSSRAAPSSRRRVTITVEGRSIDAYEGQSVASVLAVSGLAPTRFASSGAPRFAYCMMGVCFECLVSINGQPGQQSCIVRVQDGMRVERSPALRAGS
jgi:predicted molibdopterin-dependent oxidoreductase YjgC